MPSQASETFRNRLLVLIYNDKGVSKQSYDHLSRSLRQIFKGDSIAEISAKELRETDRLTDAKLFVIPGGADLPYAAELNGLGNRKIRRFVENGGSYLGICAGSYYAGNYCEFAKRTSLEVCGARELAFFAGTVRGPTLAPYVYNSTEGARVAELDICPEIGLKTNRAYSYYNGGGSFVNADKHNEVQVLAKYENGEAAVIRGWFGQGKYLLSGVHLEINPLFLDNAPLGSRKDGRQFLLKYDCGRFELFSKLIDSLV